MVGDSLDGKSEEEESSDDVEFLAEETLVEKRNSGGRVIQEGVDGFVFIFAD